MLFFPIRYINNGEPLDQITLNRHGFDIQENLEEIIDRVSGVEGSMTGSVEEVPNTLALRDDNGTTQFAPPVFGTNPMRLMDFDVSSVANKGVIRDPNGNININMATVNREPTSDMEVVNKGYVDSLFQQIKAAQLMVTSGVSHTGSYSNVIGRLYENSNFFDVFPPAGKTMSNLVAFIPSIYYLAYNGDVNDDDVTICKQIKMSDRVRIHVQNSEQRARPGANWLAIWS